MSGRAAIGSTNYFRAWLLTPFLVIGPGAVAFRLGSDATWAQIAYLAWWVGIPPSVPVLAHLAWRSLHAAPRAFRRAIALAPLMLVPWAMVYHSLRRVYELRSGPVHDGYLHSLFDTAAHCLVLGYAFVLFAFCVYWIGVETGAIDPER